MSIIYRFIGNILKGPDGKDLLPRDTISPEQCANACGLMRSLADPYAPIVIWVPDYVGNVKGRNEDKIDTAEMWKEQMNGVFNNMYLNVSI